MGSRSYAISLTLATSPKEDNEAWWAWPQESLRQSNRSHSCCKARAPAVASPRRKTEGGPTDIRWQYGEDRL